MDFTVPTTGRYEITAWGAESGSAIVGSPAVDKAAGGIGAEVGGAFNLVAGHTIQILVGEQGANGYYPSGGGGTFVYDLTASTLILAAGAGGGGNNGIGGGGGSYVNGTLLVAGTSLPFADALAPADPQGAELRNDGEVIIGAVASHAPEPASWALTIGGLALAGGALRRRRLAPGAAGRQAQGGPRASAL